MFINGLLYLVLIFFVYSFLGWVLEFFYKLLIKQELVNPGFFQGPILPIYGISVFFILTIFNYSPWGFWFNLLLTIILVIALEYFVSLFCEKFIGVRFWDYSKMIFDYKGRISLEFSLVWGILIVIFLLWINPVLSIYILNIPYGIQLILVTLFLIFFVIDLILTSIKLFDIRKILKKLEDSSEIDENLQEYFKDFKRWVRGFPDLYEQLEKKVLALLKNK